MNRNATRNYNETITNEDARRNMADNTAEFGPRKTIIVLAIVAGCFAILWPKIFYPMLSTPVNTIHTPVDSPGPMRQERRVPPHAGGLHPAMQQRGRAIPSSHIVPKVDGRPDHVVMEKMRPPLGAAGRVVPAPSGYNTVSIIMPLYTIGIFLFFLYTIAKLMQKEGDDEILYKDTQDPVAQREFRDKVFNTEALTSAITGVPCYRKERSASPRRPVPTIEELKEQAAGDIEIDQLRQRLVDTEAAMERIVVQMGSLSRTVVQSPRQDAQNECTLRSCCSEITNGVEEIDESAGTVKVMGMEMTACCETGQKISRPTTPIVAQTHSERELTPPKPIYLEGALPPKCELLVTDSETQAENSEDDTEAPVVLSGKMTLSLISHDQNQAEAENENHEEEEDFSRTNETPSIATEENVKTMESDETRGKNAYNVDEDYEAEEESEVEDDDEDDDADDNYEEDDEAEDDDDASEENEDDDNDEEIDVSSEDIMTDEETKVTTKNGEAAISTNSTEDEDEEGEEEDAETDENDENDNETDDDENDDSKEEEDEEDEEDDSDDVDSEDVDSDDEIVEQKS